MATRRDVLKGLIATAGGVVMLGSSKAWAKKLSIPLDKVEKLKTVGVGAVLKVKDTTILFVRDSKTTIRALDPVCTHEKCMLAYNDQSKQIECPCHRSKFDLEGNVLSGPASKPLKVFSATLSEDHILITVD